MLVYKPNSPAKYTRPKINKKGKKIYQLSRMFIVKEHKTSFIVNLRERYVVINRPEKRRGVRLAFARMLFPRGIQTRN